MVFFLGRFTLQVKHVFRRWNFDHGIGTSKGVAFSECERGRNTKRDAEWRKVAEQQRYSKSFKITSYTPVNTYWGKEGGRGGGRTIDEGSHSTWQMVGFSCYMEDTSVHRKCIRYTWNRGENNALQPFWVLGRIAGKKFRRIKLEPESYLTFRQWRGRDTKQNSKREFLNPIYGRPGIMTWWNPECWKDWSDHLNFMTVFNCHSKIKRETIVRWMKSNFRLCTN